MQAESADMRVFVYYPFDWILSQLECWKDWIKPCSTLLKPKSVDLENQLIQSPRWRSHRLSKEQVKHFFMNERMKTDMPSV